MRVAVSLLALILATGASAPQTEPAPGMTVHHQPSQAVCRDRIIEARKVLGLPELQREPASPDEPLFIAAVDKRIDGCSVLVMRDNTSDVRTLPVIEREPRLRRAR